VLTILLNMKT